MEKENKEPEILAEPEPKPDQGELQHSFVMFFNGVIFSWLVF